MAINQTSRRMTLTELENLCASAVRAAGGSPRTAATLARAVVAAEARGKSEVGAAHLLDYLDALRHGRLNGDADPEVITTRSATMIVDADRGTAQLAFDVAETELISRARGCGIVVLSVHDAFTAGELGHYSSRLAEAGLVALACSNSPALMSVHGAPEPITGTNPMSFALPHPAGPRMFDQAASASAWVKVRDAADRGEAIPEGWALDAEGNPTTDAASALAGALLPFGAVKAGNIALMVEMLAALSGGAFALDAPAFDAGAEPPRLGLFILAIDPAAFDPGYSDRAAAHLERLSTDHGVAFGRRRPLLTEVQIPDPVHRALLTTEKGTP